MFYVDCLSCSGFDLCVIEDLCRVGAAVASARCAIHVGGLQHLSDCMGQRSGVSKGHTRRLGQLLPSYLLALLKWSESETEYDGDIGDNVGSQWDQSSSSRRYQTRGQGKDDPYKAFIRTKLDRISQIFQSSKYIADRAHESSISTEKLGSVEGGAGEREIVGETSGQLIHSSAPTANLPSSKVLRTSLVRQMGRLADNLRLLAGPLGDKEEMEDTSMTEDGDSLTRLRANLRSDPSSFGSIPFDRFNPDEFEKEEKMNFVVTDYINEEETVVGVAVVKTGKRNRVRRDLPIIRLTESEGYILKREVRESCGAESPVSQLSVAALIDLVSCPDTDNASTASVYAFDDFDTGTGMEDLKAVAEMNMVGEIEESPEISNCGPSATSGNPATQSSDQYRKISISSDDDCYSDSGSDSIGSDRKRSSCTSEDANHNGEEITASSVPKSLAIEREERSDPLPRPSSSTPVAVAQKSISVPVSVSAPPSQFISEFLAVKSAVRNYGSGLGFGSKVSATIHSTAPASELGMRSTGSPIAKKAEEERVVVAERRNGSAITGGKVSASPATGDVNRLNVIEDPAAAHRRKVKQRLAALSSSAGSGTGTGDIAGERKKEGLPDSSTVSERSLLEEQTDTLARLVEQRIHDRWIQAAIPPALPNPFK